MVKKNFDCITFTCFVLVQFVLYLFIEVINTNIPSACFCYTADCLAVLFVFLMFKNNKQWLFLMLGFVFLLGADTFLVLFPDANKVLAMFLFMIAQIFFACLIGFYCNKKQNILSVILRLILVFILEIAAIFVLNKNNNWLVVISLAYFANLICNFVFSTTKFKTLKVLSIGFLLFIFCDVFVGLQTLCDILNVAESELLYKLAYPGFNIAWLFYLPCITLLSSFAYFNKKISYQD